MSHVCLHLESVHTRDGKECRNCHLTWRLCLKENRERAKKKNPLADFLRGRKPKKFQQHVWVRPDVGLVEIYLEDVSYHAEWIKGEGADIAILRANDKTNRVVGVVLPLRKYDGKFRLMGTNQVLTLTEEIKKPKGKK